MMDRDTFVKFSSELSTLLQTQFEKVNPEDVAHPGMEFAQRVRDDVIGMAAKRLNGASAKKASEYAFLAALASWYERQREVKRLHVLIRKKLNS